MAMMQKLCKCGRHFMTSKIKVFECSACRSLRSAGSKILRRLQREAEAPGSHTDAQWRYIIKRQGERCYWCHRPLRDTEGKLYATRDHLMPLIKGGSDYKENIVASCWPCNREKGVKTPGEYRVWLARHGKPFIDISGLPASASSGRAETRKALKRQPELLTIQAEQPEGNLQPRDLPPGLRYILQQFAERKRMEPIRANVQDFLAQKRRVYDEQERRKLLKLA